MLSKLYICIDVYVCMYGCVVVYVCIFMYVDVCAFVCVFLLFICIKKNSVLKEIHKVVGHC
jgi:hypothetical protein